MKFFTEYVWTRFLGVMRLKFLKFWSSRRGLGFGTTALKRNFFDGSCVDSVPCCHEAPSLSEGQPWNLASERTSLCNISIDRSSSAWRRAITAMTACLGARIKAIPPFGLGRSEHQLEPRPPRHRPWPFQLRLVRSVNLPIFFRCSRWLPAHQQSATPFSRRYPH